MLNVCLLSLSVSQVDIKRHIPLVSLHIGHLRVGLP